MKKLILPTILTLAIVGLAGAQTTKKAAAAAPKSIKSAVMAGKDVDIAKATKAHMYADYKGKRYFFCCGGCPQAFKADPAKYAKAASIPTPKAPKGAR